MRRIGVACLGGLVGTALVGCGGGTRHPRPAAPSVSRMPVATRSAPSPPPPAPPVVRLTHALAPVLHAAGPASGALVYDLTAGRAVFSLHAGVERPPASVEKLYTSLAVLSDLGPSLTFKTAVLGQGHLGPHGTWHGNLYLQGGGDPTFGDGEFNRVWEQGYGPTAEQVAAKLSGAGIRRVTGWVIGDPSLFDSRPGPPSNGYAPDIPDLGGQLAGLTYDHGSTTARLSPAAFAVRQLVRTMRAAGIKARAARGSGVAPSDAQPLVSVSSPPISVLLKLTDIPSDDFFAEMLTKQLGVRFGGGGSTTAGAAEITQAISHFGITPTIIDGSGLSRQDRTSPAQVVDLLRAVWGTPNGRLLLAALPVVGVNGTVRSLGRRTPAQGHCQAKTGTLNYVTNLAGYCESRGGHVLAFALFLDGPSNVRGVQLLSRMVAAVARY